METKAQHASDSLESLALAQLRANVRTGYDPYYKADYSYVRPSRGRYDWMWFWDSCFHAVALAKLDPVMARQELRQLLISQRPDGFIGHIVYWGRAGAVFSALFSQSRFGEWRRRHSGMIQPPLLAQALEAVHTASPDAEFLKQTLPPVQAYYDWLDRNRDIDGSGLIWIVAPWESGLDNSPVYDGPLGLKKPGRAGYLMRLRRLDMSNMVFGRGFDLRTIIKRGGFAMVDPLVQAYYADGLRSLARLHSAAGDTAQTDAAVARARRSEQALMENCWDAAAACWRHLSGPSKSRSTVLTAASVIPLVLEGIPKDAVAAVVSRHLTNPREFWTPLPVPSVAASEPSYDPEGESLIWRGPVCMNLNWTFVRGLRLHGYNTEAEHITSKSREAAEANGFREFYSPATGRGMRGTKFGWATVAAAM